MSDDRITPAQMRLVNKMKKFAADEYGFNGLQQDAFVMGVLYSQTHMTQSQIRRIYQAMEGEARLRVVPLPE